MHRSSIYEWCLSHGPGSTRCGLMKNHAGRCAWDRPAFHAARNELAKLGVDLQITPEGAYRVSLKGASEKSAFYSEDWDEALARANVLGAGLTDIQLAKLKRIASGRHRGN